MTKMEQIEMLQNSAEFMEKVAMIDSLEECRELFSQHGVELTVEELSAMLAPVASGVDGELSLDELDDVSGGGFFSWLYNKLKKKNTSDLEKLWK